MKESAGPLRSAVERLLDQLGEADARELLSTAGHASARQEFERVAVMRVALRLLEERAPRWQVRDRLIARGISRRSAYRLIDAALSAPVTCRATDGPGLALGLRSIERTQSLEDELATTINDMTAKLERLRDERLTINVATLRREAAEAEAARDANAAALRDAMNRRETINPNEAQARHAELATRARECASKLFHGTGRAQALDREIERLSNMLNATERIAAAVEASQAAQRVVDCAQDHVEKAEEALRKIGGLIEAEQGAYEQARVDAAAQLLSAVKLGNDPAEVPAATRDKLTTLELARVSAQQELQAARAAKDAAVEQHRKSLAGINQAKADEAAMKHELAFDQYVETLSHHMAAHIRAGRGMLAFEDPRIKANQAAHRMLEG